MYKTEDADLVFVAYGTVSRIVKTTIESMRKEGYKVGLIRPKLYGHTQMKHSKKYQMLKIY